MKDLTRKYLFALMTFSFGCAKPTYLLPAPIVTGRGGEEKLEFCSTRFAQGACLSYAWEKLPTEKDFGSFTFKIFRANLQDGTPVAIDLDGTIAVVFWMPSMGHASSPLTVIRVDTGTYRVSRAYFTMRGEWEIRFQLKDGATVKDQVSVPFVF